MGKKIIEKGKNDLASVRPDLAKEWDYEKNAPIRPEDVTVSSNKKVWWKCANGHEWQAYIGSRNRWSNCPYCSGKVATPENCLATKHPSLAKEWNYDKNKDLSPTQVTCGSVKKVWWKCEKGHEWQADIESRVKGSGCPYCSNKKCLIGYNDLQTICPGLAAEWDYDRNGDLKPTDIVCGSQKKVWWKCANGHEWSAIVAHRVQGSGCPYCSGALVTETNSLANCFPDVAQLWDYEKNYPLTPAEVAKSSSKLFYWKCEKGHQWKTRVSDLTNKHTGCPYCSGKRATKENNLAVLFPNIAAEWNYEKNGDLTPDQVTPYSQKKVWWQCEKGHEWKGVVGNRTTNGAGCPQCNNRSTSFPEQAILYYCRQIFDQVVSRDTDTIGIELDIFIPEVKTAIEYDGRRWHQGQENEEREQKKDRLCIEHGIRLIRVMETGLENKHPESIICIQAQKENNQELEKAIKQVIGIIDGNANISVDLKRDVHTIKAKYIHLNVEDSFGKLYPELAKEWDYERNGQLTPFQFTSGSNHKAWWKCEKGHEWQAKILDRKRGGGCPYCNGRRVLKGFNDLMTTNPDVASQWHPIKNGDLRPESVSAGSNKKVWWKCEKGHEYAMSVTHRIKDHCNCPYCAGKRVSKENSLETKAPELVKEWDYEKNGDLTPSDVTCGSSKKVWWKCEKGHSWNAAVHSRFAGQGCPYCAGKKIAIEESLEALFPILMKEWDYEKNEKKPSQLAPYSGKKAWWKCEKGHSFEMVISNRTANNSKCPYCQGRKVCHDNCLGTLCPEIAKQWDYEKNGDLTPNDVVKGSKKEVWWKCEKGHSWQEAINKRTRSNKKECPICSKRKADNVHLS